MEWASDALKERLSKRGVTAERVYGADGPCSSCQRDTYWKVRFYRHGQLAVCLCDDCANTINMCPVRFENGNGTS